jgi:hypothetical protein
MHELVLKADPSAGGPGGGREQRLPLTGERLVAGRSAQCDIRIDDEMASRRHFMLAQSPAGWQITDLNSTNGTLLNGRRLPPDVPVPLALSDRITVGHATYVMQRSAISPEPPPGGSQAQVHAAGGAARRQPSMPAGRPIRNRQPAAHTAQAATPVWQWILSAFLAAAIFMLAYGAFQPWVRVQVELTFGGLAGSEQLMNAFSFLDGFRQSLTGAPPMIKENALVISGMDSYGRLMLVTAAAAALMLVLDLVFRLARSVMPGIVYLVAALLPGVVLAVDLERLTRLSSVPILFGINLLDIFQGASKIVDSKVAPLPGIYLTLIGLALLILMGVLRAILPVLPVGRR